MLRAPEVRKKKTQSFHEAAAESYGSGSSIGSKKSKGSMSRSNDLRSKNPVHDDRREEEEEVLSPLKNQGSKSDSDTRKAADASRSLFQSKKDESQIVPRKRKAKGSGGSSSLTPDLNLPVIDTSTLVPAGLVSERVNQLGKTGGEVVATASEASPKKQKRSKSHTHALSALTAGGSPRQAQ